MPSRSHVYTSWYCKGTSELTSHLNPIGRSGRTHLAPAVCNPSPPPPPFPPSSHTIFCDRQVCMLCVQAIHKYQRLTELLQGEQPRHLLPPTPPGATFCPGSGHLQKGRAWRPSPGTVGAVGRTSPGALSCPQTVHWSSTSSLLSLRCFVEIGLE